MSNQILISSGAKLRDLDDVIIGTDGVLTSLGFNVANGVPKLDENGKILVSQLPNSVMEFKGVWNAATNTPTLANGTGNAGDVYLCNVAGTVNFGAGPITFAVGDYAVYTGTVWARSSGATGTVTSVGLSRDGDALSVTGSPITTSGTINLGFTGTNLQYINGAGNLTTFPDLTVYVPTSRTLTINDVTYDLSANRSWTIDSMIYPDAGIAVSTGTAWGTSIIDNSGNWNTAYNNSIISASVTGTTTKTLTLDQQDGGTITASWTDYDTAPVTSVFGRTGAVVAVSGDYTTAQVTESGNLYFTDARARAAISLTTLGTSGAATYNNTTGVLNIPNYTTDLTGYVPYTGATTNVNLGTHSLSAYDLIINHTSGSGVAASITKNGAGEALTVVKGSGSGNAASITGGVTLLSELHLTTDLADAYIASAANWNTAYNNRITSATSPLSIASNVISISLANTTTSGYLSSTDWNTFNGKQNAITNPVTGTGTVNYLPKWGTTSSLADSRIFENSTGLGLGTNAPFGSSVTIQYAEGVRNRNSTSIRYRSDWVVTSVKTLFNSYDDTTSAYLPIEINSSFTYFNAIAGTGNVAIGTSTDAGFKLDVNGNSRITGSITVTGIYRDYQGEALIQTSGTTNEIGSSGVSRSFRVLTGTVNALTIGTDQAANFTGTVQGVRFSIGGTPFINVGFTYKGTLNGNTDTWGSYQGALSHAPTANNSLAVGYHSGGGVNKGTYTGLSYRGFQQDAITSTGTGTLATAYGVYIDAISAATNNYSAYFAQTVLIGTTTGISGGGTLQVNGNVNINGLFQINGVTIGGGGGSGVTGSGTANYLTKWTGSSTLSNSVLYESGSNIAVGNTTMIAKFNIYGVGGGTGSNSNLMLTTGNNSDYFGNNQIVLAYSNTAGQYAHAIKTRHNSASYVGNAIDFYTWKHGDSLDTIAGQYVMTMYGNGCVGIGETNPTLSVGATIGGLVVKNSSYLQLRLSSIGSESAGMEFKPNGANAYEIQANSNSQWFVYDRTNSQYRLNIFSNGNVVLGGNSDNGYKLQITGSASFAYGFLSIFRGSSGANDIFVGNDGSRIYIGGNTYVVGNVTATGGFFDTSDARLKTLVEDNYLLSSIANVKARLYKKDGRMELGYYAQDLENILPSAVKEGVDGFLSLSYAQVHTAKIAVIEDEVTILKNRVSELETKLQKYDA